MTGQNSQPDPDRGYILWFIVMGSLLVVFVVVAFVAYWKYLR